MHLLDEPVPVGDVTAREATELRERREAATTLDAEIAVAEDRLGSLRRLQRIVYNEQVAFITGIVSRLGLDPRASYRVDDRTGVISRVGVPVPPEAIHTHVHEPVPVPEPEANAVEGETGG